MSELRLPTIIMAGQDVKSDATLNEELVSYVRNDGERYLFDINKNLVQFFGTPLIQSTLDTVIENIHIGDIAIVGPEEIGNFLHTHAYLDDDKTGYIEGKTIKFRNQSDNRVQNALIGNDALKNNNENRRLIIAGDLPLVNKEYTEIDVVDKFIAENFDFMEYSLVIPFIDKRYAKLDGEQFRPPESWIPIKKPVRGYNDCEWGQYGFVNDDNTKPNLLVKEGQMWLANFRSVDENVLESLGDGAHLVKLRGFGNIAKAAGYIVKTIFKNEGLAAPYEMIDSVNTIYKTVRAKKKGNKVSGNIEGFERIVQYLTGLDKKEVIFPETKMVEQHVDLDSLEDAYWIARVMHKKKYGEDIHRFQQIEANITYKVGEENKPLIDAIGYDTKEMAKLLNPEQYHRGLKLIKELNPRVEGAIHPTMKEFFYAKMNHQLWNRQGKI